MEGGASVALSGARSTASWRERLPTLVGLAIILAFVGDRLRATDIAPLLEQYAVRFHPLHGGGYWIDPQSLDSFARMVTLGFGVNWVIAISLVLIWSCGSGAHSRQLEYGLRPP